MEFLLLNKITTRKDSCGSGAYTAQFWQYDTRIGRRWNKDQVVKPWESPYATFANNPIWFVDPLGNDSAKIDYIEKTTNPKTGETEKIPGIKLPEVKISAPHIPQDGNGSNFTADWGQSQETRKAEGNVETVDTNLILASFGFINKGASTIASFIAQAISNIYKLFKSGQTLVQDVKTESTPQQQTQTQTKPQTQVTTQKDVENRNSKEILDSLNNQGSGNGQVKIIILHGDTVFIGTGPSGEHVHTSKKKENNK